MTNDICYQQWNLYDFDFEHNILDTIIDSLKSEEAQREWEEMGYVYSKEIISDPETTTILDYYCSPDMPRSDIENPLSIQELLNNEAIFSCYFKVGDRFYDLMYKDITEEIPAPLLDLCSTIIIREDFIDLNDLIHDYRISDFKNHILFKHGKTNPIEFLVINTFRCSAV
jgi:hypothetical protein